MVEPPVVGVLGGSFDPVHLGHLGVAQEVRRRTGIARVLLLPCASPPHKPRSGLAAAHHREAMLRLAIAGREGLEVCTLELRTGRICYTLDSLRQLRRHVPPLEPVFIIGTDSLLELTSWREHATLIREFDMIVADRRLPDASRPADPLVERALVESPAGDACSDFWSEARPGRGGRIFHLPITPIPVSSSAVRARVAEGASLHGLVPPAVARYIHVKRLYLKEENR